MLIEPDAEIERERDFLTRFYRRKERNIKKLLNTLFVFTQGAYLARKGETVAVRIEGETRLRTPIHNLEGIVALGRINASPDLMELCGERDVGLTFLTEQGRFKARVTGPISGNVLLRRAHYRLADDPVGSARIARGIIAAKIANCRQVLLRANRESGPAPELSLVIDQLADLLNDPEPEPPLDIVRGLEGRAASLYFGVFNRLVANPDFNFSGRNRRPPRDPVNSMLSFLYSVLAHDLTSALEGVGLDPACGFLHRDRPGRPSLALDLMEELRPVLVDRVVLTLINRNQVSKKGFTVSETGAVLMAEETRKTIINAYQERKRTEITHPFLGEKAPFGLIGHLQARLMARFIRGDLDGYPPFIWR